MVPHYRMYGSSNVISGLTLDEFMKHNPPCKECLVQGICLKPNDKLQSPWIRTRLCGELNEFIINNKFIEWK